MHQSPQCVSVRALGSFVQLILPARINPQTLPVQLRDAIIFFVLVTLLVATDEFLQFLLLLPGNKPSEKARLSPWSGIFIAGHLSSEAVDVLMRHQPQALLFVHNAECTHKITFPDSDTCRIYKFMDLSP